MPYSPAAPIDHESLDRHGALRLAREVMLFQQTKGAAGYLTAALPLYDSDIQSWLRQNDLLLEASCSVNGGPDLDRKPLIAQVAPGRKAIESPELIANRLMDYPMDGVYVQPHRLDPARDSTEKLVLYTRFLLAMSELNVPVVASRVGAFGLVLQALGIAAFDSGLGEAERADLASLNRAPTERERSRKKGGGPGRRIYLERLKTTLKGRDAEAILSNSSLRSRFVCPLGCCRHRGFEDLSERRRKHYLWVRHHEVNALRGLSPTAMQDQIHEGLRDARDAATLVRRHLAVGGRDAPSFDHIDRWITVLGRDARMTAVA